MIKKIKFVAIALAFMALPFITSAATLYRELQFGMSGSDVSSLQTFLASDPTIYPQGLVTGYFGYLTKSAVSNFQAKNGIATVGRVGPITMAAINSQMSGTVSSGNAPMISNVYITAGSNTATVNWNTNGAAKGVVYYSNTPLTTYENINSVDVSGSTAMTDVNLHTSQSVSINGLQKNTTYYYLIYTTNGAGIVSVTWPTTFSTTN